MHSEVTNTRKDFKGNRPDPRPVLSCTKNLLQPGTDLVSIKCTATWNCIVRARNGREKVIIFLKKMTEIPTVFSDFRVCQYLRDPLTPVTSCDGVYVTLVLHGVPCSCCLQGPICT